MTNEEKATQLSQKHYPDEDNVLARVIWKSACMEMAEWKDEQYNQTKQQLYDIIIALWDILDKIDTFSDLQIDDINPNNPFRKIEQLTQERHKFVMSDGYNLYIDGEQITTQKETTMSNEEKANEMAQLADYIHNKYEVDVAFRSAMEMAEWKDEQFETAINEIKANVIEARDNKEYYATNRETTLNWILRLIDECCESISMQKGE